jgi:hypothetical protein
MLIYAGCPMNGASGRTAKQKDFPNFKKKGLTNGRFSARLK